MTLTDAQINTLTQQGIAALQKGEGAQARTRFEEIVAARRGHAGAWLGLAYACNQLNDSEAMMTALDRCLALEPANLHALLLKADSLHNSGQKRQALGFYQAALTAAGRLGNAIPPDLRPGLQRAQAAVQAAAADYGAYLRNALKKKGVDLNHTSRRFSLAFDLAIGKRQLYLQQPTRFYYPELPQIQFYDSERFDWAEDVEAATDSIRDELLQVLREDSEFPPYLVDVPDVPHLNDQSLIDNPAWGAFYFWKNGPFIEENAARCPKTVAALESVPLPRIEHHNPSVLFSLLKAHTRIPPHNGMLNTRLICHLPLIVPKDCGALRCGNETRAWEEGKLMIFDDSIEHEAWNNSNKTRVVLLFDIWRPEIPADDRLMITAMLEAASAYYQT